MQDHICITVTLEGSMAFLKHPALNEFFYVIVKIKSVTILTDSDLHDDHPSILHSISGLYYSLESMERERFIQTKKSSPVRIALFPV